MAVHRAALHAQDDRVLAVGLGQQHVHHLALGRRQVLAHVVGPDRQLAVTAVDQHGELDRPRPAEVAERVQGRAHGPAGVEHVVDEDHDLAVDARRGNRGVTERPGWTQPQVVAVHGDVERACRGGPPLGLGQLGSQAARERHSPGRDAEQNHVAGAVGALEDLVRDPGERAADLVRSENDLAIRQRRRAGLARAVSGCRVPALGLGPGLAELGRSGGCGSRIAGIERMHHKDPLSRLTGRGLKDVCRHNRTSSVAQTCVALRRVASGASRARPRSDQPERPSPRRRLTTSGRHFATAQ